MRSLFANLTMALALAFGPLPGAEAFELEGTRGVWLVAKDGGRIEVARIAFTPAGPGLPVRFALTMAHERFTDHFLSMREFKCLPGSGEILCHVPYPYPQPATLTRDNLAWLEHSLLFMFKLPSEFGAKLWNGVYFQLRWEGGKLVGLPQAVDLNLIGAPPAQVNVPPFRKALRDDIREGARWFTRLEIE
jgi:hypothetical protein